MGWEGPSCVEASQSTRIFFSWIADFSTESHCAEPLVFLVLCCARGEAATHDLRDVCKVLIGGDGDGLDEELVAALGIEGRLLLHSLEEDCEGQSGFDVPTGSGLVLRLTRHLDFMTGLDAARVRPDAVPAQLVNMGHGRGFGQDRAWARRLGRRGADILLRGCGFDLGLSARERGRQTGRQAGRQQQHA